MPVEDLVSPVIHVPLWFETEGLKAGYGFIPRLFSRGASTERNAFRGDLKPRKKAQDAKRLLGFAAALLPPIAFFKLNAFQKTRFDAHGIE